MSVCGICNLDLLTKPRSKTWEGLLIRFPKLKGYFDQPEEQVDIPMSVDYIVTTCKATFHNICITEWLMLTKSLTCPACEIVMPFADMRKKHFKDVQVNQDSIRGYPLSLPEVTGPCHPVTPHGTSEDAAKGDFRSGRIKPEVIHTEVLHNHVMTTCTTYSYKGKSRLLEDLASSDPVSSDELEWSLPPPWDINYCSGGAVKDEPIVFNLTPYHSRSGSSAQDSDSGSYCTTEKEPQPSAAVDMPSVVEVVTKDLIGMV